MKVTPEQLESITALIDALKGIDNKDRRVRTPEGVARFKKPIGSIIVAGLNRLALDKFVPSGNSPAHNEIHKAFGEGVYDNYGEGFTNPEPNEAIVSYGDDGKVNGALSFFTFDLGYEQKPNVLKSRLKHIYVQNTGSLEKGIGTKLVNRLKEIASERKLFVLLTPEDTTGSEVFWKKMGFQPWNFGMWIWYPKDYSESKSIRRVRTPEGAEHFGKPIGAVIDGIRNAIPDIPIKPMDYSSIRDNPPMKMIDGRIMFVPKNNILDTLDPDYVMKEPYPVEWVYRAISEAEWEGILKNGYMKSDERMNIATGEGTVAATRDPTFYLPPNLGERGRVVKFKYDPEDNWRVDSDGYLKTDSRIPIERFDSVSDWYIAGTPAADYTHDNLFGNTVREMGNIVSQLRDDYRGPNADFRDEYYKIEDRVLANRYDDIETLTRHVYTAEEFNSFIENLEQLARTTESEDGKKLTVDLIARAKVTEAMIPDDPASYRISHQPDLDGPSISDIEDLYPGIYENPEWYSTGDTQSDRETLAVINEVRGNPDAMVVVYRGVPEGVTTINPGDWVSLSRNYARQIGMHATDPNQDMPVISMEVPARFIVEGSGNSINEWGYKPILSSDNDINKTDILSGLSKMASNFEDFESFSQAYSLQGIRPRVWHTTEDSGFTLDELFRPTSRTGAPELKPVLFTTTDPEYWDDYTAGREYVVEFDISELTYGVDKDYYSDQSGNDGIVILPSGYSKLKRVGIFSREEAQDRSGTQRQIIPKSKDELFEIWNSSINTLDADKNETGNYAEKFKAAKETGGRIGLTKETFEQIKLDEDAGNLAQYGLTDESSSLLLRALELREERLFQQNKRFDFMSQKQRENLANNMDELRSSGTIMIAMDNNAAEQVLQDGVFKSQFETNTSNGMLGEEVRSINETAAHDIHPEINPRLRPIYGYVAGGNLTPFNVMDYGEIRFELEDYVKERATMTDGDSLGSPATPVPMTGPPLTEREAVAASFGWNGGMYEYLGDDIFDYMDTVSNSEDGGYVEAQILGGVSIRDIKTIYVPDESNSFTFDLESFTELAEKLGIGVATYVT